MLPFATTTVAPSKTNGTVVVVTGASVTVGASVATGAWITGTAVEVVDVPSLLPPLHATKSSEPKMAKGTARDITSLVSQILTLCQCIRRF